MANGTWEAWHDHQPIGPPRLHVSGSFEREEGGLEFSLVRSGNQGANDKELSLDLTMERPQITRPVLTLYDVKYEEDTEIEYDAVSIRPDGPTGIPVREVTLAPDRDRADA